MNRTISIALAAIVALMGITAYGALFTVDETQQGLVLQFGNPIRAVQEPGLHFKIPYVQNVEYYEDRILDFDAPPVEAVASDKKRIVVDAFSRYKIDNPLLFRQTVRDELTARNRLESIVNSSLRKILGRVELIAVLSGERSQLMQQLSQDVNREATKLGLRVVDVRIKRADLPEANSQAVFRRMQAEREREAREARARGAEESQKIKADADRERTVLLAEAKKRAEILRGEGDAVRSRIFAEAFNLDPEFFAFYRSLQAYRNALQSGDTTMVLSPNSDFFSYFGRAFGQQDGVNKSVSGQ